jgi:hypothetical protein
VELGADVDRPGGAVARRSKRDDANSVERELFAMPLTNFFQTVRQHCRAIATFREEAHSRDFETRITSRTATSSSDLVEVDYAASLVVVTRGQRSVGRCQHAKLPDGRLDRGRRALSLSLDEVRAPERIQTRRSDTAGAQLARVHDFSRRSTGEARSTQIALAVG